MKVSYVQKVIQVKKVICFQKNNLLPKKYFYLQKVIQVRKVIENWKVKVQKVIGFVIYVLCILPNQSQNEDFEKWQIVSLHFHRFFQ